ncbi:hypothetical protein Q73_15860 [Bacillus coahuilensis m2-6]|uniref:CAAX prenyl protease 2/Lysostaphin resistance protein A-like domain-containing protein n=1 Tax=Bacillus coahuilensis p1.1.43 TaxID=1150625 RepID=A0A147K505_9BACI|nr:CPBP family glutamic-type intramembrane protease [Bacillus coahuilensis]KUP04347.1 hypothetical protein Q73_15860 [Bacillus coahuilensis m2-6]KUP04686.1 hypothetical protein Q75_14605 [Bacillus coahuilensis p1.1.43]
MKVKLKLSLFFTFLGFLATLALLWVQESATAELLEGIENAPSPFIINVITVVQQVILTFLASIIGLSLLPRVGLEVPFFRSLVDKTYSFSWSRSAILTAVFGGAVGSLIISLADTYVFSLQIPSLEDMNVPESWVKSLLMSVLYGGVWEEIFIRLFFMTLIIWLLSILFRKTAPQIPVWMYWAGIMVASVGFGIGHLPATASLFGELTTVLVVRAIVLNGVLGVFFGYLFWKKGLVYAMIAHVFYHVANFIIWMHIF